MRPPSQDPRPSFVPSRPIRANTSLTIDVRVRDRHLTRMEADMCVSSAPRCRHACCHVSVSGWCRLELMCPESTAASPASVVVAEPSRPGDIPAAAPVPGPTAVVLSRRTWVTVLHLDIGDIAAGLGGDVSAPVRVCGWSPTNPSIPPSASLSLTGLTSLWAAAVISDSGFDGFLYAAVAGWR